MNDLVNLIVTNGCAVVIIAYFLFKDYKQTGQMISVLGEVKDILLILRERFNGGDPN